MSILDPTDTVVEVHQEPLEFTNQQLKIFWLPDEIKVEKDVQDILVNMTDSERHGVITTLKLFTLYELKAGSEYWGTRYRDLFPAPEFQRMAATFSMVELAIHKPFYQKINELLHLHTDEFYSSYKESKVLQARVKKIDSYMNHPNVLVSVAAFSMVEGVILYSSFAFLKHFQSAGKNKLLNIVRGINFSVRDENLHSQAGAWTYKQLIKVFPLLSSDMEDTLYKLAEDLYLHECEIVDILFEKGEMEGITSLQLKRFVASRINVCLEQLGLKSLYQIDYNPIASWFYSGINGFTFNDTFSGIGNSYVRNWDETAFTYKEYVHGE